MEGNKRHTERLSREAVEKFKQQQSSTKQLNTDEIKQFAMDLPSSIAQGTGLALFMPRRSEPLVINDKTIVTLGRKDNMSGIQPTVDLTEFHGAELGVSRFHAEISITDGRYFIKDMGSTNGTWVNGKKIAPYRLTPIRSGDQLRLGHLSIGIG